MTVTSSDSAVNALLPESADSLPSMSAKPTGVEEEIKQYAKACLGQQGEDSNKAGPRDALWDLGFIQGCLESGGEKVDLREFKAPVTVKKADSKASE